MFSYRGDHPLWACKTSVSLRHGAGIYMPAVWWIQSPQALPLPFLLGFLQLPEHSSRRGEYGRGFFSTRLPLLIEHGRGETPGTASQRLTQFMTAHLESKSTRTLLHQKEERELGRDVTSYLSWSLRMTCTGDVHVLQEQRRTQPVITNDAKAASALCLCYDWRGSKADL